MKSFVKSLAIRLFAFALVSALLFPASPAVAQVAPAEAKTPADKPADKPADSENANSKDANSKNAGTPKTSSLSNDDEANAAADDEPKYLRIKTNSDERPTAMQTAVVRYRGKPGTPYAGRTVDLFGVVHIGEAEYYDDINQRLSTYDVVLYELVAPDGTRIRPEDLQARRSLLASMQTGMKDMLNFNTSSKKSTTWQPISAMPI